MNWQKLGKVIQGDPSNEWLNTHTGASYAQRVNNSSVYRVFVTGRDQKNRSHIGTFLLDIDRPQSPFEISPRPIFSPGELGTFDENGVSYPYLVKHNFKTFMYYVGWMPTVLTPFQNHIGLAESDDGIDFKRVSRAPILERTNDEPFSLGSMCVRHENGTWRMWYTSFVRWGSSPSDHKHYYSIKHATSTDGVHWLRNNQLCIPFLDGSEYSIGRPSIVQDEHGYKMWFCVRGKQYRIGYASSPDGLTWKREDNLSGIDVSQSGWDSEAISYPFVFEHEQYLYMLYCGNDYGRAGLGLARRPT